MQVKSMLEKAFPEAAYPNTILHSDQGWQYQHEAYHRFLDSKGIIHLCLAKEPARITA